ncbi:MAG TPA: hypothetical protein VHJ83_16320 [Micromonosporaceae bacterium]|nr:hypothetical protein [Micromonosporaceae bacterium]
MADNVELVMRFHLMAGEDVSVLSKDFGGEAEALEKVARAVDEQRSLVLTRARYDREAGESGVVVNLANVVSVQVSKTDSATTGQYL